MTHAPRGEWCTDRVRRLNITVGGFPRQAVPQVPEEIVWSTGALWFYCPAMFNFILFTNQFVQEKERRVRLGK